MDTTTGGRNQLQREKIASKQVMKASKLGCTPQDRGLAPLEVLLSFCLATNVLESIFKDKPNVVDNSGMQLVWNPKYLWKYDTKVMLWAVTNTQAPSLMRRIHQSRTRVVWGGYFIQTNTCTLPRCH